MTEGETAAMKWIINLLFGDMLTRDINELLDSWALIFAIVPFGALIFCGMYVGQFILDSTMLGVVLMFVFPLVAFAVLYYLRKMVARRKNRVRPSRKTMAAAQAALDLQSPLVVVCIPGSKENGHEQRYALRRENAIENAYVQMGNAPSIGELKAQFGAQYTDVDWTYIVEEPAKDLTASLQRTEARPAKRMRSSQR
ncbi:MAG: hypothetical protein JWL77_1110 [Chthonomonadaceae bacterium]|nr:hypothetical protein [Chthonomonadaceae bacterium]